jgi:hypothetical protein
MPFSGGVSSVTIMQLAWTYCSVCLFIICYSWWPHRMSIVKNTFPPSLSPSTHLLNFLMSHTGISMLNSQSFINFTSYNTLSPWKSDCRTFLYQWRRLLNTLQYYYSNDNENQRSADEGRFILLVSAIISLLPGSLFGYTEDCVYFSTFPCIIYFVYYSKFSAYMWYMYFC